MNDSTKPIPKPLYWVGSSKQDMMELPLHVISEFGHGLYVAQCGQKHDSAKVLSGFGGAGVLELIENFDGNTYRAVYTVKFASGVYVLHCFQKKSNTGIATPQPDMDKIRARLKLAETADREGHNDD